MPNTHKISPNPIFGTYPALEHLYKNIHDMRGRSGKKYTGVPLSTLNNLHKIHMLLETFKPKHTLEIGMALGGSTTLFAEWHKRQGHPNGCHVAIDPFQHSVWDHVATDHLKRHGLDGLVELLNSFSSLALPDLVRGVQKFGLIYVDGSHLFEDVFVDFYYSIQLLPKGGVIVFDDSADVNVAKVHAFIRKNMRLKLKRIDFSSLDPKTSAFAALKSRLKDLLGLSQAIIYLQPEEFTPREWNAPFHDF